jgi:hypothetical protein
MEISGLVIQKKLERVLAGQTRAFHAHTRCGKRDISDLLLGNGDQKWRAERSFFLPRSIQGVGAGLLAVELAIAAGNPAEDRAG